MLGFFGKTEAPHKGLKIQDGYETGFGEKYSN